MKINTISKKILIIGVISTLQLTLMKCIFSEKNENKSNVNSSKESLDQRNSIGSRKSNNTVRILTPMFTKGIVQVYQHMTTNKLEEISFDITKPDYKPIEINNDLTARGVEVAVFGTFVDPINNEVIEVSESNAWHAMIPNNKSYKQIVISPITELSYWRIPYPDAGIKRGDYESDASTWMSRNYGMFSEFLNIPNIEMVSPSFLKVKDFQNITSEETFGLWIVVMSRMAKAHAKEENDDPKYYNLITLIDALSKDLYWNYKFDDMARNRQYDQQPAKHGKYKLVTESFRSNLFRSLYDFLSEPNNYSGLTKNDVKNLERSIFMFTNNNLFPGKLAMSFELNPPKIQWHNKNGDIKNGMTTWKGSNLRVLGSVVDESPIYKTIFKVVFEDGFIHLIETASYDDTGFDGSIDFSSSFPKYRKCQLISEAIDVFGNRTTEVVYLEITK